MAEVTSGVSNVAFKSPPFSKGLMKEAPISKWADVGGVWDVDHMICKDGTMAFGPGAVKLTGDTLNDISSFGTVERIIPLDYSAARVGIVITSTSLFYVTPTGFEDIVSDGLGTPIDTCRGIFTHSAGTYVSYTIGEDGSQSYLPCLWFTNGKDTVFQLIDDVLSAVLTTHYPVTERPYQIMYKDSRLFTLSLIHI